MCGRRSCNALTKDSDLKMLRLVFQIKIRSRTYSMVFWYNMRFQLWVIRTLLYTVCVRSVFTHCCCSVCPLTPSFGLWLWLWPFCHIGVHTWSGNDSDSQTPLRVKASSYYNEILSSATDTVEPNTSSSFLLFPQPNLIWGYLISVFYIFCIRSHNAHHKEGDSTSKWRGFRQTSSRWAGRHVSFVQSYLRRRYRSSWYYPECKNLAVHDEKGQMCNSSKMLWKPLIHHNAWICVMEEILLKSIHIILLRPNQLVTIRCKRYLIIFNSYEFILLRWGSEWRWWW